MRTRIRLPSSPPTETFLRRFAGPVPLCVDFVNTSQTNKHFVRDLGRSVAPAFSRYESVTTRKRALRQLFGRGDHHETRILAVWSRRGLKSEALDIRRLEPARVCGRDAAVNVSDYKCEFTAGRSRDLDLVADAGIPERQEHSSAGGGVGVAV